MKTRIEELISKVNSATPTPNKSKYRQYLPVVNLLLDKGFTLRSAVGWIVAQGDIDPAKELSAYFCIIRLLKQKGKA